MTESGRKRRSLFQSVKGDRPLAYIEVRGYRMKPNYRRCISCRLMAPKTHFLRITREHSTGKILLNRGMGRSAYVCPQAECIALAKKKKRLERALKAVVSPEIYALLECYFARTNTQQKL
jgi:uncharacterized protein